MMQARPLPMPVMNSAPPGFAPDRGLPPGFASFYGPLHEQFARRQQELAAARREVLARAHEGKLPGYLCATKGRPTDWRICLPQWCTDQRNQMTGPADDAELVVKMLNSGAPGVMLDLEDSMVNTWDHVLLGHDNIVAALYGELVYYDGKRNATVGIKPGSTVIWNRVRGLHLSQAGIYEKPTPASLFDVALLAFRIDLNAIPNRTLCIYIPKSESAEEALWWRDVFDAVIKARGWRDDAIKCMALVESHPLAYQLEEFTYNLRKYLVGLNLGRWDYMASLIHYNLADPQWVLPDRNTIPLDVPFFQRLRTLIPEVCHKHGMLAIGGMTALYPSREDPELNARALDVLARDKKNEADCLMDGAWTGHPDQNGIAVAQFPHPNQLEKRPEAADPTPDLRPKPLGVGKTSLDGTRAAIRTVIRYRHGVLSGKGASLLDGYMEDLATDRIYRLMLAQRMRHPGPYTPISLGAMFEEELQRILHGLPSGTGDEERERYRLARQISERMILSEAFDPV
jgi:malate synthase